jgi:hypothetical protein
MTLEEIGRNLPALFGAIMLGILFIQSGLDKIFDWKGNLEWLNGHFSKTFLGSFVPALLATITVMEVATGFFERGRRALFSCFGFAQFDVLRGGSRCIFIACTVFRSARGERLSRRGGHRAIFYFDADNYLFNESVFEKIVFARE